MSADVCMVFDDHGNAFDAFPYTADELEQRSLEMRRENGEVTTVTIGSSPFLLPPPCSAAVSRTETTE